MTLVQLLPYVLPPVLGAVIGYVTNYIAIRMLFRPLKPWHVFGLRVPLTPGIIPSKREELARSMGGVVGSHLLTSRDVGRALEKEVFRRELQQAVNDKLGSFLDRDLGPLASLVPAKFQERFRELVETLRWKALKALFDYLQGEEFGRSLRDFLERRSDEFLQRSPASVLTGPKRMLLMGHLERKVTGVLGSEGTARTIERLVDEQLDKLLGSDQPLRELLPEPLVEALLTQVEREIPALLDHFGGMLYDPEFRARLVERASEALGGFISGLGPLANLVSNFINRDKIEEKLPGFLDQAGDEISRWLREDKTQQQIAGLLRARLGALLERSLASFVEPLPYEKVVTARRFIQKQVVEWVQSPAAGRTLRGILDRGFDAVKDRSFNAMLVAALPAGSVPRIRENLATRLLDSVTSPAARDAVDRLLAVRVEQWIFHQPLGCLSARLSADVRSELQEGLFVHLSELLKKEVPQLVDTLNVQRVVEEKINTLDVLTVERLLLDIMEDHFKYINLFGALLGALIGLVNLLVLGLT